jgi:hypothetical protein
MSRDVIVLRGGPFRGLKVPATWADPHTGEIVICTADYVGGASFRVVTCTYRQTADGVATFTPTDAPSSGGPSMAMKFAAPDADQKAAWADYRFRCMSHAKQDPGPCPEQWPADAARAAQVIEILRAAGCDPRSFEQVRAAFAA